MKYVNNFGCEVEQKQQGSAELICSYIKNGRGEKDQERDGEMGSGKHYIVKQKKL